MAKEFLRSIGKLFSEWERYQQQGFQQSESAQPNVHEHTSESRKRVIANDEFSGRVYLVAGMFEDNIQVRDLFFGWDRKKRRIDPEYNPPSEWGDFMQLLEPDERGALVRIMGEALRAGYETLGDLRQASVKELEQQKGIGTKGAKFLQGAFRYMEHEERIGHND